MGILWSIFGSFVNALFFIEKVVVRIRRNRKVCQSRYSEAKTQRTEVGSAAVRAEATFIVIQQEQNASAETVDMIKKANAAEAQHYEFGRSH